MRKGEMPKELFLNATANHKKNTEEKTGYIVLVHGYCSPQNPWSQWPEDWSNAAYFLSSNSNDPNDVFAKKVASFVESQSITAYSIAGYSQGGMVVAHLANYYWSGLDLTPSNGRILQSLVTPFLGNSAAGTTASLGKLFGVGCGPVTDLTKDGANLWVVGISSEVRSKIYYYYVTFDESKPLNKYCNAATNLFLQKPNDGVVEMICAQLKGANDCGRTQGQCHTTGMRYPAAYTDHGRNQEMNSLAARS